MAGIGEMIGLLPNASQAVVGGLSLAPASLYWVAAVPGLALVCSRHALSLSGTAWEGRGQSKGADRRGCRKKGGWGKGRQPVSRKRRRQLQLHSPCRTSLSSPEGRGVEEWSGQVVPSLESDKKPTRFKLEGGFPDRGAPIQVH